MGEESKRIKGTWNGKPISINGVFGEHEFTDEEAEKLFKGEVIEFEATSKDGRKYMAKGKLEEQEYNGTTFVGFSRIMPERYTGIWNGKEVSFKKKWYTHEFTEEEAKDLFAGKEVTFEQISKNGNPYMLTGKLAEQEIDGHKFVGFKRNDF